MAVYTANAFSNFHNFFKYFKDGFEDAADRIDRMHTASLKLFSWADEVEKKKQDEIARRKAKLKRILNIILLVVLIATSIVGAFAGPILGAEAGIAGAALGALSGAIGGAYAGGKAVAESKIDKTYVPPKSAHRSLTANEGISDFYSFFEKQEIQWAGQWTGVVDVSNKLLLNMILTLLGGAYFPDSNGRNSTVIDVVTKSHFYLELNHNAARNVETYLAKEMSAMSMDLIWRTGNSQYPYIVMANAEGGSCSSDHRSFEEVRVCLDEYPDKSFWLYAIDGYDSSDYRFVHRLPGQSVLECKSHPHGSELC